MVVPYLTNFLWRKIWEIPFFSNPFLSSISNVLYKDILTIKWSKMEIMSYDTWNIEDD
jgi:hypothetical protein